MFGARDALLAILALIGVGTVRTFSVLTAAGYRVVEPNKLAPLDVIQVRDDSVIQFFAPDQLNGDSGTYVVASVQRSVVVAIVTASGTREQVIEF